MTDDRKIAEALDQAARAFDLPERFQQPGAVLAMAGSRHRRRRWQMLAVAAGVVLAVLTAGLTAAAQGGMTWPWRREAPTEAEIQAATQAYDADVASLAEAVRPAEARAAEVGTLTLSEPLAGAKVTDPFGRRRQPNQPVTALHTGVDFSADEGAAVHAAADGTVTAAETLPALGNVVVVTHGKLNGVPVSTWYAHNRELNVTVGQQVKRGDSIASVGATGAVTGPHLHFEVRVGGEPVNPMEWLKQ